MKKKMSFSRLALPSLSVLAAAVISLTSVTYAWFTYGNEAKVEQITVNVESAGGLQMSIAKNNAFNWSSSINVNEVIGAPTLTPVSTNGSVTTGKLDFFTAQYDDVKDKIYDVTAVTVQQEQGETISNYIAFDLYFRNAEGNDKVVDLTGTEVKAITGASNLATRIAFVQDTTTKSTAAVGVTPWDGNTGTASIIYEPNADKHTEDGKTDYALYNGGTNTGAFTYKPLVKASTTGVYYDRYTGESYTLQQRTTEEQLNSTDYFVLDTGADFKVSPWNKDKDYIEMLGSDAATEKANNRDAKFYTKDSEGNYALFEGAEFVPTNKYYLLSKVDVYKKAAGDVIGSVTTNADAEGTFITLDAYAITKVTVFIWIEGQDADCTNFVSGQPFSVDLVFNATAVPTQQGA